MCIRDRVSRVHDAGFFSIWLDDLYADKKESILNVNVSEKSESIFQKNNIRTLAYNDLELHFFLLHCGLFLSLVVLILEILWYRIKRYVCKCKQ